MRAKDKKVIMVIFVAYTKPLKSHKGAVKIVPVSGYQTSQLNRIWQLSVDVDILSGKLKVPSNARPVLETLGQVHLSRLTERVAE